MADPDWLRHSGSYVDESDWCRQSTVREVASIVHTRGTMTMHILVHKGSSDPSYCSSRTTSENAEAWLLCEARKMAIL